MTKKEELYRELALLELSALNELEEDLREAVRQNDPKAIADVSQRLTNVWFSIDWARILRLVDASNQSSKEGQGAA